MRKLMWFALGFAAACAIGVYLAYGLWPFLLIMFFLAGACAAFFWKTRYGKCLLLILAGCCAGTLWFWGFDGLYLNTARKYDGKTLQLEAELSDFSYATEWGCAAEGSVRLEGKPYRCKIYIPHQDALNPGSRVSGMFRLRYTGIGGEKDPTYHKGKGIFLLCYSKEISDISSSKEVDWRYLPAILRQKLMQLLDRTFPEDTVGFARALLLGDDSLLSPETDAALQTSGIRHIIAVSGLHISILFGMIYVLCGKRRVLTAILGIPVLVFFAAAAGFTPSVVRACVMQILMIAAMLLDKEYDPPTALSFAVLLILTVNPLTVTSVSFQLSVGCMIGILLFSVPVRTYFAQFLPLRRNFSGRLLGWCVNSVSVTLGAMTVTIPLCACYFGKISLIGIVTNLLTLWAVSVIFYGIMAACLGAIIWLPLGSGIAWFISWGIRYVTEVSSLLSEFPLSAVSTDNVYITAWLLFCYGMLGIFLKIKKKKPVLFGCCLAVGLLGALFFSWLEPRGDTCRVTVLDVGQGQSILLQSGSSAYLVDCGSERKMRAADMASAVLLTQGITNLDGIILTHYDSDHVNGVLPLLSRISVERIYMPDTYDENGRRQEIEKAAGQKVQLVTQIAEIPFTGGKLTIFPSEEASNDNESGLCVLFEPENYDILITGDRGFSGEKELMACTDLPKLELLVVGHHGSKNSTGFEFLHDTYPAAAAISAGKNNSYGHPAPETLERLALFGCKVMRTDRDGTIVFRGERTIWPGKQNRRMASGA